MITKLNDSQLIEIYFKSIELNLEKEFVSLLKYEIERRGCILAKINPLQNIITGNDKK
jgi:hypothetical protein